MYIGRVPCLSAAKFSQNYAQVRVMCLQPSKQAYQEVWFVFSLSQHPNGLEQIKANGTNKRILSQSIYMHIKHFLFVYTKKINENRVKKTLLIILQNDKIYFYFFNLSQIFFIPFSAFSFEAGSIAFYFLCRVVYFLSFVTPVTLLGQDRYTFLPSTFLNWASTLNVVRRLLFNIEPKAKSFMNSIY